MNDDADSVSSSQPAGIQFARWPTVIENDDLVLGKLHFDPGTPLITFANGKSLSLPSDTPTSRYTLEATFISVDKEAVVRVSSDDPIAFRVLDENGLTELWAASLSQRRTGCATFRATGHQWSEESFLVFLGADERPRFSYIVATKDLCLELVCVNEPIVKVVGRAVVKDGGNVR